MPSKPSGGRGNAGRSNGPTQAPPPARPQARRPASFETDAEMSSRTRISATAPTTVSAKTVTASSSSSSLQQPSSPATLQDPAIAAVSTASSSSALSKFNSEDADGLLKALWGQFGGDPAYASVAQPKVKPRPVDEVWTKVVAQLK
eukprot:PhM_4_TR13983/c0_g1_i1/m.81614